MKKKKLRGVRVPSEDEGIEIKPMRYNNRGRNIEEKTKYLTTKAARNFHLIKKSIAIFCPHTMRVTMA